MSLITFISDFGSTDHYIASVKASTLKYNSNIQIVDISHQIKKYDISHAAYVFKNVYKEFPQGTIHMICVNHSDYSDDILLFQLNNQYSVHLKQQYQFEIIPQKSLKPQPIFENTESFLPLK